MAIKSIYKLMNERITSDSIVHKESKEYINLKEYLKKFKTEIENFTKYQPGDTYENDFYLPINGHITNASKNVVATLVLPKRLDNIKSITCNKLVCEARGIKGYLNSQAGYVNYVDKSGYTVSCRKNSNCSVEIRIAKSTAFTNVDNNTPITLALGENKGDIKLTFE